MYKLSILLLYFVVVVSSDLHSEETSAVYNNQIQLGIGYNTFNKIYSGLWILTENADNIYSGENRSEINFKERNVSSFNLSYSRPFKERGTWGASFTSGFYKLNYDLKENEIYSPRKQITQIYTLTPNLYFHYLQNKTIQLYFGVELGLLFYSAKAFDNELNQQIGQYNKIIPVFNISPIGMRLKYKFSPYVQANIGARGWIEGGVSYNFGQY
ncbi:MAG TPA: hypothetical protein VLZ75_06120 [Chitinophagales bacterium]|nr:hypothetical protein [Chitinophagales bacterium]